MSEDAKSSESDYESSLEEDEFSGDVSEEADSESDKRIGNKRGSAKKMSSGPKKA